MPQSIVGTEWYNVNSLRKYPLADDATCLDTTGSFKLPSELIVDLSLPVSSGAQLNPDGFYVSELALFGQGLVLVISYDNSSFPTNVFNLSGPTEVCRLSVSASSPKNTSYFMHGLEPYFYDVIGTITIGDVASVLKNYSGMYSFNLAGGKLISTCIRPDARGVSALSVVNGTEESTQMYGDIQLIAGTNVRLQVDTSSNAITIDAIDGLNLNEDCGCATTIDRDLPPCIRSINSVGPDAAGNLFFNGSTCIVFEAGTGQANSLLFKNACYTPCCTSSEINDLLIAQQQLTIDVRTQQVTMIQLQERMTALASLEAAITATGLLFNF